MKPIYLLQRCIGEIVGLCFNLKHRKERTALRSLLDQHNPDTATQGDHARHIAVQHRWNAYVARQHKAVRSIGGAA